MKITKKIKAYVNHYGILNLAHKVVEKQVYNTDYNNDRLEEIISDEEIEKQKNKELSYRPFISIIMPVFNPDRIAFVQTLNSIKEQTYGNFELCISDGGTEKRLDCIDHVFINDSRIKYISVDNNPGISENTNNALLLADGDIIALMDHDDVLEPNALYEMVQKFSEGYDMVYSDEDKVTQELDKYFAPYRKPDYNRNLLLSNNYICHLTMIKREIVSRVGHFRSEFDGAQDYDYFLRVIDVTENIGHVNKVLYHWRVGENSTSDNPFNKDYAYLAGKKALEAFITRNNIKGVKVAQMEDPGYYRIRCGRKGELTVTSIIDGVCNEKSSDYYLLLDSEMMINDEDIEKLLKRAYFTKADIVVPKIVKNGRYLYNGIAKAGNGHTINLKGKPEWFSGPFNLAKTNMDIVVAPSTGILIKKELYDEVLFSKDFHINTMKGRFRGARMVYAPEAIIAK